MVEDHPPPSGRWWWAGLAVGGAVIVFGLVGLLRDADQTMPANWAKFVVLSLILHDGVFAPAALVLGLVAAWRLPAVLRPLLAGALGLSVAVTVVAVPVLTGNGRLGNNPSILPRDYTQGWLICLAVIWGVTAVLAARTLARRRA